MSVLLYTWEYGHDLGHVSVFLPIAKELRNKGWQIIFSIPYLAGNGKAKLILESEGFDYLEIPGADVADDQIRVDNHVQLLNSLPGFRSEIDFEYFFAEWLLIIDRIKPDVVVGDFSVIALLAAQTRGIKTVCLDLGFFVPPPVSTIKDLPSFSMHDQGSLEPECSPALLEETATSILEYVNKVLTNRGGTPLSSFLELYKSDLRLILNYPELIQFNGQDAENIFGAVISNNGGITPTWPKASVRRPKVFVYLKLGATETARVAEALAGFEDTSVLMYIPKCTDAVKTALERPHITVSDKPFNIEQVFADANLVICHAGAGMIAQSLLHGIPMLVFPQHLESRLNAARLVSLGAGMQPQKGCDSKKLQYLIHQALCEPMMAARARAFALRNKPADVSRLAEIISDLSPAPLTQERPLTSHISRAQPSQNSHIKMTDFDVFFWAESCDTPRWHHLKTLAPNLHFIQTTDPLDAVYKARELSKTDRFITISDRCEIHEEFFNTPLEMPRHLENAIWRWPAINNITGLTYPSNELICWSKIAIDLFAKSPKHNDLFGFYRYPTHYTFSRIFSTQIANRNPEDAFITSYKAAHSLAMLFEGDTDKLAKHHNALLTRKLFMHMSLGNDCQHGAWSVLSSRLAFVHALGLHPNAPISTDDSTIKILFSEISENELSNKISSLHATISANIPKPGLLEADANKSTLLKQAIHAKREPTSNWFSPFDINSTL